MKLLIQPGDGPGVLIKAINAAKRSVELAIFRFDQTEIERALAHAVSRGVTVHALIAHTNRAGEENLRELELRLLSAGVTVARTADDLQRYHGKFMIVDRRELYILGFNLTQADMEGSRSFGLVTRSRSLVHEAVRLFEADSTRVPYDPGLDTFVVSPGNARTQLSALIEGARKRLLIYDPKISDANMIGLLADRAQAGVDVRVIGKVASDGITARKLARGRLHTRTIIRDSQLAFIGSQSLRDTELDTRREVGVIFRDAAIVSKLAKIFGDDWRASEPEKRGIPAEKLAKKVAKALTKELPPVATMVNSAMKECVEENGGLKLNSECVQETVSEAVKQAVKDAVKDAVENAVEQTNGQNSDT